VPDDVRQPNVESVKSATILGVRVDVVGWSDLLELTLAAIKGPTTAVVSNVNIHALNIAYEDPVFRNFINSSDAVFCDGYGVKLASALVCGVSLDRIAFPDWFGDLAGRLAAEDHSLFLLGAGPGRAEKAASTLCNLHPRLKIVGTRDGYFDKNRGSLENESVVAMINEARPDILAVGFGMPLQERWLAENIPRLNVGVAFTVGATFDYVSGAVRRAPRWTVDHGLEWIGRLAIEPRRLWRRYLLGIPLFAGRLLLHHAMGVPLPWEAKPR
jgi:N-acetylglucosaminyldiphosphoundecaprenol N-acetyl-beta-D-mannosaminyltransferase